MERALFHHLALPAHLPQSEDSNLDDIEASLRDRLIDSARSIQDVAPYMFGSGRKLGTPGLGASIQSLLESSAAFTQCGKINSIQLAYELKSLSAKDGTTLLVYVRGQNAAIMFHRLPGYVILDRHHRANTDERQ